MKISIKKYILLSIILVFCGQTYSQETPSGHAEVWENVKTYWDLWAKRDLDGFLEYYHVAYSGWNYEFPMHKNKESTKKWLGHDFQTKEVVVFDVDVIDIKIHDNIAIVHYYYSILEKTTHAKEKRTIGRKTDVLKKQENKWVIIADHSGIFDEK